MAHYHNYHDLQTIETEGRDYAIQQRRGHSGIAVMAPHGGGIEPGTTEIADAVAGDTHTFYSFTGTKPKGNRILHMTSREFDEPMGVKVAARAETILTIHGCTGEQSIIYIGGRNIRLRQSICKALRQAEIAVRESARFPGVHPRNICNRSRRGMGVQLELSAGLRRRMFHGFHPQRRQSGSPLFRRLVRALQTALWQSTAGSGAI